MKYIYSLQSTLVSFSFSLDCLYSFLMPCFGSRKKNKRKADEPAVVEQIRQEYDELKYKVKTNL